MTQRTLAAIAAEIRADWKKPYFGAVPYLDAMRELSSVSDRFGPAQTGADMIVARFLTNAGTWRGETARRVKKELKGLINA